MPSKFSPPLTSEEIAKWRENPLVNPRTSRAITEGGEVWTTIRRAAAAEERGTAGEVSIASSERSDGKEVSNAPPSCPRLPTSEADASSVESPAAPPPISPPRTPHTPHTPHGSHAHHGPPSKALLPASTCSSSGSDGSGKTFAKEFHREDDAVLSSRTLLTDYRNKLVEDHLVDDGDDRCVLAHHFDVAIASYSDPLPLFRSLDDARLEPLLRYSKVNATPDVRKLTITNSHDGQRKLTMALLEFVADSLMRLSCSPRDVVLVYAGASGLAGAVAASIFPGLRLLLYDPHPNTLSNIPSSFHDKAVFRDTYRVHPSLYNTRKMAVFTDRAGWFRDEVAEYCRDTVFPYYGAKHMLFVSDVRGKTGELDIAANMRDQMRWTVVIGCSGYMHKFKIPYMDDAHAAEVLRTYREAPESDLPPDAIERGDQEGGGNDRVGSFPYLDGRLHVQVYGPQRTAELRLIGFSLDTTPSLPMFRYQKRLLNDAGKRAFPEEVPQKGEGEGGIEGGAHGACKKKKKRYRLRTYVAQDVEDRMATFNVFYRCHSRFASEDARVPPVALLSKCLADQQRYLPNSYETVCERVILGKCAAVLNCSESGLAKMHNAIGAMLAGFTNKDPLVCALVSASMEMRKQQVRPEEYAPHVLTWARQVSRVRPDAAIPAELLLHVAKSCVPTTTQTKDWT